MTPVEERAKEIAESYVANVTNYLLRAVRSSAKRRIQQMLDCGVDGVTMLTGGEVDERALKMVEDAIGLPDSMVEDFRRTIITYVGAMEWQQPGSFKWDSNPTLRGAALYLANIESGQPAQPVSHDPVRAVGEIRSAVLGDHRRLVKRERLQKPKPEEVGSIWDGIW